LNDLIDINDFLNQDLDYDKKLMAHCYDAEKLSLKQSVTEKQSVLIMIGPEGDFTLEEVEQAKSKNILPLSLGTYRLRTETAGVASVQSVAFINS
jgi:16S rRNA (uracil1498-N3)-methyltransferase